MMGPARVPCKPVQVAWPQSRSSSAREAPNLGRQQAMRRVHWLGGWRTPAGGAGAGRDMVVFGFGVCSEVSSCSVSGSLVVESMRPPPGLGPLVGARAGTACPPGQSIGNAGMQAGAPSREPQRWLEGCQGRLCARGGGGRSAEGGGRREVATGVLKACLPSAQFAVLDTVLVVCRPNEAPFPKPETWCGRGAVT